MSYLFVGKEWPGHDRCAGHFMDGNAIKKVMVIDRHAVVLDQFDKVQHTDPTVLPQDFQAHSIGCIRSAQTGKLIVVLGGLTVNTGGQISHILATDYFIQPPAVYQG